MFNVLRLVGEVLKSNLVSSIITALINDVAVPAPNQVITETVNGAATNARVCDAAQAVIGAIVPSLRTWSTADIIVAEGDWEKNRAPTDVTVGAAFAAGAAWALAHQTASLTTGIAGAASHGHAMPTLACDVLNVGLAAATGGTVTAVATAVGEAVQLAEQNVVGEIAPQFDPSKPENNEGQKA